MSSFDDLEEQARGFIREATWTYARSMPDNPHWYVVIPKEEDHRIEALLNTPDPNRVVPRPHTPAWAIFRGSTHLSVSQRP